MADQLRHKRLETETIVIGYAMSRLDRRYLVARRRMTWNQAYAEASEAMAVPGTSFKNLRDEFDPVHSNPRVGWDQRQLRASRQRVLDELEEVSDEALLELVARILNREGEATVEAIDSLAVTTRVAHNVAERLLTGRRAEEFFLANVESIAGVRPSLVLDFRQAARGFDFGVEGRPELALEVKGMKQLSGDIQFTDREWSEARYRRADYWLIVVGNLVSDPTARVIYDPHSALTASCSYQKAVSAVWRARVKV